MGSSATSGSSAVPTSRIGSPTRRITTGAWTPRSAAGPGQWPISAPTGSTRPSSFRAAGGGGPGGPRDVHPNAIAEPGRERRLLRRQGPVESVDIHSEDAATMVLRFEGGARGSCVVSRGVHGPQGRTLNVDGSLASLTWDQAAGTAVAPRAQGRATPVARPRRGAGRDRRSVAAGRPPGRLGRSPPRPDQTVLCGHRRRQPARPRRRPIHARGGSEEHRLVEAALQSSDAGTWVSIRNPIGEVAS